MSPGAAVGASQGWWSELSLGGRLVPGVRGGGHVRLSGPRRVLVKPCALVIDAMHRWLCPVFEGCAETECALGCRDEYRSAGVVLDPEAAVPIGIARMRALIDKCAHQGVVVGISSASAAAVQLKCGWAAEGPPATPSR